MPLTIPGGESATFTGNKVITGSLTVQGQPALFSAAPPATANRGLLSLGSGPFDGASAGFFVGSASGTVLAANAASGYAGNLLDLQVAGVRALRVETDGSLTAKESFAFKTDAGGTIRTIFSVLSGWDQLMVRSTMHLQPASGVAALRWRPAGAATGPDLTFSGTEANGIIQLNDTGTGGVRVARASGNLAFFGGAVAAKQTVTGAHGSNAALQSLLTALAAYGLIVDSSS